MSELTQEQKKAIEDRLRTEMERIHAAAKEHGISLTTPGSGGNGGLGSPAQELSERERAAATWERMTPAERVQLFTKDRTEFDRLAGEAAQLATDKLMAGGARP